MASWLAGWGRRVKITIDSGDITAALTNFPVLIYLSTSSGINNKDLAFIFEELGANSLKIAVTENDGTTECKVEIEKWDNGSEEAWLWVKVPAIASGADTDLYLYFDNDHADNDANVGVVGSAPGQAVWDGNFLCVLHFSEAAGDFLDSTANGNDASAHGGGVVRGSQKIDGGIDLAGTDDYARIDTTGLIDGLDEVTVESWVYLDALGDDRIVLSDNGVGDDTLMFKYDLGDNKWYSFYREDDAVPAPDVAFGDVAPSGAWYHIASKYIRSDFVYGYQNGVETQGNAVGNNPVRSPNNLMFIGINRNLTKDIDGKIDEVRFSDTGRSEAWLAASYESGDDDLIDYGAAETSEDLPCEFNVRQAASADLAAEFIVSLTPDLEDLAAEFIVRQAASADLLAEFLVGVLVDDVDLPGEFIVRQTATVDLHAEFLVTRPDSADLHAEFDIRQLASEDLLGEFVVRHSTTASLLAEFSIRRSSTVELPGEFVVRHADVADLLGAFIVRHGDLVNLTAEFVVRQTATVDLAAEFIVTHSATRDLPAEFSIRRSASLDLTAEFIVRQAGSSDLLGEFIIRHTAVADLPAAIWVNYYGVNLPAEFYVRPTTSRASDFTIIDNTRGLTIHDPDRKMTVTPRRRMRVK